MLRYRLRFIQVIGSTNSFIPFLLMEMNLLLYLCCAVRMQQFYHQSKSEWDIRFVFLLWIITLMSMRPTDLYYLKCTNNFACNRKQHHNMNTSVPFTSLHLYSTQFIALGQVIGLYTSLIEKKLFFFCPCFNLTYRKYLYCITLMISSTIFILIQINI